MRTLRAAWRLFRATLYIAHGALICAFVFPRLDAAHRMRRVGSWCARTLELMGVTLQPEGAAVAAPILLVANHVSWLDILAINAVQPVRFVSKSDVRRWPVLGYLVACGGTLFIERERKRDALRVVHQVAQALAGGERVAVFPEGTTSDGRDVLPFHANLLQAAITIAAPVQPVTLRYDDAQGRFSSAAAYIGDTSLVESLWAVAMAQGLRVHLRFGSPHASAHAERRALAAGLRAEIVRGLDAAD